MATFDLGTVEQYIKDVRTLLLDNTYPYRYSDDSLLVAFNLSLLDGRRLRPDLFVYKWGNKVPAYGSVTGEPVPMEPQFRKAFVYGTAAHAIARDQDDIQDARSNSFMGVFSNVLTGSSLPTANIQGATPSPQQRQQGQVG
jgi:hypothetical protein